MSRIRAIGLTAMITSGIVVAAAVGWYLLSPLFYDRAVSESFPATLPAPAITFVAADATAAMEEAMAEPTQPVHDAMPTMEAANMAVLAMGEFYPVAHEGEGRATIYALGDGNRLLRFENFSVLNGPDLHVYLVPVDPVADSVGVEIAGSYDLGELKGNIGDQNYELPPELDLSQFKSVVIWCQPFRVPFAAAPLAAP